ncbi:helix-turn-helix domain-containing protein [Variovorax guangxiensis]|uniref:Helix-turn-helix domain-containing protein n=1 Tax=Variovorax guangxiensis TaxID=1775474 RepID=A0A433MHK5_9BURK|nr:helix-turn-helix transcriptional regulator [Variovorax guangxiensis]RUR67541.1 helix-turn-helix domain-containing protein [Variovorax guangxiensis]
MSSPVQEENVFSEMALRVRLMLAEMDMNQGELARRLGLSPGYVSEISRGVKRPGADFFLGVHRELNVSVDWLISGNGGMFRDDGIQAELLHAIRVVVATARAAIIVRDPLAVEVLQVMGDGRFEQLSLESRFAAFAESLQLENRDLGLSVSLYNSHLSGVDSPQRRRQLVSAASAYFRTESSVGFGALVMPKAVPRSQYKQSVVRVD